jgi:hypothetical protein
VKWIALFAGKNKKLLPIFRRSLGEDSALA